MPSLLDLSGTVFGRLTVIRRANSAGERPRWECQCSCGNKCVCRAGDLRGGRSNSCGCLRKEVASEVMTTHGLSESSEYRIWSLMLNRCSNPRADGYQNYGGRGISVCERWGAFENFVADMGRRPSASYSIDRYPDNDGNYEPDNCRWATRTEQANNTRQNRLVEYEGSVLPLREALRNSGSTLDINIVRTRLWLGWDIERALTAPLRQRGKL